MLVKFVFFSNILINNTLTCRFVQCVSQLRTNGPLREPKILLNLFVFANSLKSGQKHLILIAKNSVELTQRHIFSHLQGVS